MLSFFKRELKSPPDKPRGYKITNTSRNRKYGIAATSYAVFKRKVEDKLKIEGCRLYLASDGTEITDGCYFNTIPEQSLLIAATAKDTVKTDFELFYEALRNRNIDLLKSGSEAMNFITNNRDYIEKSLSELKCEDTKGKEEFSNKADDPGWFLRPDEKFNTKEDAMIRRAQDRIRGYFYKTKDQLLHSELFKSNPLAKTVINEILVLFRQFLFGCNYFGCLFDRSRIYDSSGDALDGEPLTKRVKIAIETEFEKRNLFEKNCVTLCNQSGRFHCQGPWNLKKCGYENHSINPYSSRENLIVFQMWNLDHQVEISRTVLPSMLAHISKLVDGKAKCQIHNEPAKSLNVLQYFQELFTSSNLKLVHIACHDKGAHSLQSKGHIVCRKCKDYKIVETFTKNVRQK